MPPTKVIYLVPPSRARLEDQTNRETPTVSSAQCQSTGCTDTSKACIRVMKSTEKLEKNFTSVFSYMLLLKVTNIRNGFTTY